MRPNMYQIALIFLGTLALAFLSVFLYREIFPEYRIYQQDYLALEKFRSSYTGEPPSQFKEDIKQIVIENPDKGPPVIDRCVSCHVALEIPYFSPTKIDRDINGNIVYDQQGLPVQVSNEEYIWAKLDQKIDELKDVKVIEQLRSQNDSSSIAARLKEAEKLAKLKTAQVGEYVYNVEKVLAMHPLMGRETYAFEYHPLAQYGCVSCHNGNGRGLTTDKAHGPIFDEQYEPAFQGHKPAFLEPDPNNDPAFSRMFNHMPGEKLLFQTTPIFVGALIQAKCVQCHQSSEVLLKGSINTAKRVTKRRKEESKNIQKGFDQVKQALIALLQLKQQILDTGLESTLAALTKSTQDYALPLDEFDRLSSQLDYLQKIQARYPQQEIAQKEALDALNSQISQIIGSPNLVEKLEKALAQPKENLAQSEVILNKFIQNNLNQPEASGGLFVMAAQVNLENEIINQVEEASSSLQQAVQNPSFVENVSSDIDKQFYNYHRGEQLYISQACYACHRITGTSRGGVGPELTNIGSGYPWYIKRKLMWPQGDLPSSTMPNMVIDHSELQDLMVFLLGQRGDRKNATDMLYKVAMQEWENGGKQPWELPLKTGQIHDLNFSMTVFATEGCAACHRLKGFESNVGYALSKQEETDFDALNKQSEWFQDLFPETIVGSDLVKTLENNSQEIDRHIVDGVRQNSLLEEIAQKYPNTLETFYTAFKYAARAKDHDYAELLAKTKQPKVRAQYEAEHNSWKTRVNRVLMMFIQEYGLGRLIGPRPNWSGVYRSDEWLMQHFMRPSEHVARSIMPTFPFDNSKFLALTYMLDVLGVRNRNAVREVWEHYGFDPVLAAHIYCSQCHGEFLRGDGPVAEWIYPVPKNLRNAEFLRNLTRERVIQSIKHGVKGTPMPPWGETPSDKSTSDGKAVLTAEEIEQLTDWLFSSLPGGEVIKNSQAVPKWQYTAKDAEKELKDEGHSLPSDKAQDSAIEKAEKIELEVFDVLPAPVPDGEKHGYYIKKKYDTSENIEQGRNFFELNCAVCHGTEADGSGTRAEFMREAKPRMLTNLDWINTRDDLRLLQTIKYGVPGTAMTPWGDLTNSLQRMQLVLFIRSLSESKERLDKLSNALYQTFDVTQHIIEEARRVDYSSLDSLQKEFEQANSQHAGLYKKVAAGEVSEQEAAAIYQKELELYSQLKKRQELDKSFENLKLEIEREAEIYQRLGNSILNNSYLDEAFFNDYIQLIELNKERYEISEGKLIQLSHPEKELQRVALTKKLQSDLQNKIAEVNKKASTTELKAELNSLNKLYKELTSELEEAARLRKKAFLKTDQIPDSIT